MQPDDLCVLDPVTSRVLVPAASLGEALEHVDRLEAEVVVLRWRLAQAREELRQQREKPPWWGRWRRREKALAP